MSFLSFKLNAGAAFVALAFFIISCGNNQPADETLMVESTDSSVVSLNEKIKQDPSNPDLYHQRAILLSGNNDLPTAFYDMRRAISIDSTRAAYFMTLGEIYFMQGEGGKALQAYQQASDLEPENQEALLKQAELKLYMQNPTGAIETIDQALLNDKFNAKAYFMKGMAFKQLRDTMTALSSFQTAVEQDPEYFHAYMQLGIILSELHDPVAEQYLKNAINVNPLSIEAHYALGMFLQQHGNPEAALEPYSNILALDSINRDALFNTAYVYSEYLDDQAKALEGYDKVTQLHPNDANGWYMLGLTHERMGNKSDAITSYKKSLAIQPDYDLPARGISRLE